MAVGWDCRLSGRGWYLHSAGRLRRLLDPTKDAAATIVCYLKHLEAGYGAGYRPGQFRRKIGIDSRFSERLVVFRLG